MAVEAAVEAARREAQPVLLAGTAATIILALGAARAAAPTVMVQPGLQVGAVGEVAQSLELVDLAGRALSGRHQTDRAAAVEAVPTTNLAVPAEAQIMAAALEGLVPAPPVAAMAQRASS